MPVSAPPMTEWDAEFVGTGLTVSEDKRTVNKEPGAEVMTEYHNVAVGNAPIRKFPEGWFCELSIKQFPDTVTGGLVFGLSTCPPSRAGERAKTSVFRWPESLVIDCYGYVWKVDKDGECARTDLRLNDWDSYNWKDDDVFGFLIRQTGELRVYFNGTPPEDNMKVGLPIQERCDLYLVVELVGRTVEASLRPEAKAPVLMPSDF